MYPLYKNMLEDHLLSSNSTSRINEQDFTKCEIHITYMLQFLFSLDFIGISR